MSDFIELGKAHKGHGLRGEVKFKSYNLNSDFKYKGQEVLLRPLSADSNLHREGEWFKVQMIRGSGQNILKLENFEDLTAVEKILPFSLFVKREDLPSIENNEYLLDDLIGLVVLDYQTLKKIGTITTLREGKLGINLIFNLDENNEQIELPFKDQFFPQVNMEEKTITCHLPEYI